MRTETRHSLVLVVGTGVTALLGLVYSVYAGRRLGPAGYADFAAAVSFIFLCNLAVGPINGTVTRFAAEFTSRGELGKTRALAQSVANRVAWYGLIGLGVALLALKPLGAALRFDSPVLLLMVFAVIYLTPQLGVARGVLRGTQRFGPYNSNIVFEAAIRLAAGVPLLAWFCNASAGVSAYLVALVAVLVVSRLQLRRLWSGCPPQPVDGAAIRRFTGPMFIMMLTSAGFQNIDMLTVKHYFDASDAGLYGATFTLARTVSVLATPFTTLLLPLLTTMHEQGRTIGGTLVRVHVYFLLLAVGPIVLFSFWPEPIMAMLYAEQYAGAGRLLLAVTVIRVVGFFCHMLGLVGAATNRFRFLYVYLPGLAVQLLAVVVWHETVSAVIACVLVGHVATLLAMMLLFAGGVYRRRGRTNRPRRP